MNTTNIITTALVAVTASAACTPQPADTTEQAPPDLPAEAPAPSATTPPARATTDTTSTRCGPGQFVACHTGEVCARKGREFVTAKTCHTTAAAACDAARCEHGCNLYGTFEGGPKMALCAPNASSSGHMKRCGGLANWQCPENMRCEVEPGEQRLDDPTGTCVADDS